MDIDHDDVLIFTCQQGYVEKAGEFSADMLVD